MNKSIYLLICGILFFLLPYRATAQFIEEEIPDDPKEQQGVIPRRFFFGGNLGLAIGNERSYINISPLVGYRILPNTSAGLGVIFEYDQQSYTDRKLETYVWGGKIFFQSIFFDALMLYGENNIVNYNTKFFYNNNLKNSQEQTRMVPWMGAGYYQKTSSGSGLYILFLVNINYDPNFIYPPYDFRIGFNF